jgi:hypothetical protein
MRLFLVITLTIRSTRERVVNCGLSMRPEQHGAASFFTQAVGRGSRMPRDLDLLN